jgi:molybdenum-dependent DNA-binding transcriptional regulator ModE
MDLRAYYQKIREMEKGLAEPCVVVSVETSDGGKAGVRTEVTRQVAARMVVEGRARVANDEETREFLEQKLEAKRAADQLAAASRMQVTVVPSSEWRNVRPGRTKE